MTSKSGTFLNRQPLREGLILPGTSRKDLIKEGLNIFAGPGRGALTAEELIQARAAASSYADSTYSLLQQLEREQAQQPASEPPQPAEQITQSQQAMRLLDPIPWVIARRRNNRGGVLHFPPATEARFETSPTAIKAYYHCVLGAGEMGSIQTWQVRIGDCRRGQFSQAYGRRTGSWTPGNAATGQSTYTVPEFPTQCGGGGDYVGITTIEISDACEPDSDKWKRALNVFVTDGLYVQRILDNVYGPTDNIVDVWLKWRRQNERLPDSLIDFPSLTKAAKFLEQYGLLCNAVFSVTTDIVSDVLPWFLLKETKINGKYGLAPMVRCDDDGVIGTGPTNPDWVLTGDEVLSSLTLESVGDATKPDLPLIVLWRQQQTDKDVPIIRTLYVTTTGNGLQDVEGQPSLNTIDLSRWCDNELHAARVGSWYHSKQLKQKYAGTIKIRPGQQSGEIKRGDVVQAKATVATEQGGEWTYSQFFTVESISIAADGAEQLNVSHLPVDEAGRSIPDMAFLGAEAPGVILPHPLMGGCDLPGRANDTSVPAAQQNISLLPFSQLGQATFVPTGTGNGSGKWGHGDTATKEEQKVGGYIPKEFPPQKTGGKEPKGGGKPGRKTYNVEGSFDECKPGKVAVYHWKVTDWAGPGPSYPEPYPYAYLPGVGFMSRNIVECKKVQDSNGDTPEIWHLSYIEHPSGNEIVNATKFAYPFVIELVAVTCEDYTQIQTRKHIVQPGDTLYGIAGTWLGAPNRWPEIYDLNKNIIDNPNLIYPGQALTRPAS